MHHCVAIWNMWKSALLGSRNGINRFTHPITVAGQLQLRIGVRRMIGSESTVRNVSKRCGKKSSTCGDGTELADRHRWVEHYRFDHPRTCQSAPRLSNQSVLGFSSVFNTNGRSSTNADELAHISGGDGSNRCRGFGESRKVQAAYVSFSQRY